MRKSDQRAHTRTCTRGVTAFALLALVAATGAGCDDDDTTGLTGGTGGMAGRGGSGGRGGTAGSAGMAGSSGSAGSAGSAGTAGTGGSSAGTGGSSAGTGGSNDGDAGVDAATGDAGPEPLTQEQVTEIAEDICASYDALAPDCESEDGCVDSLVAQITFFKDIGSECEAATDAYFSCMAGEPIESFECVGDAAGFASETVNCDDEAVAFNSSICFGS